MKMKNKRCERMTYVLTRRRMDRGHRQIRTATRDRDEVD